MGYVDPCYGLFDKEHGDLAGKNETNEDEPPIKGNDGRAFSVILPGHKQNDNGNGCQDDDGPDHWSQKVWIEL